MFAAVCGFSYFNRKRIVAVYIDGVRSGDVFLCVRRVRYDSDIWRGVEQADQARARCHSINAGDLSQCVRRRLVRADTAGAVEQTSRLRRAAQRFRTGPTTNYRSTEPT